MINITSYSLANGIHVILIPNKNVQSVSVVTLINVGSRFENPEISGIAHFAEHMFFKGTEKRPESKDIAIDIETIGGSSNAFTSYDYTGYYIKAPKDHAANCIEILSDMLHNSNFKQTEIDKERGVIIEEIKMYEDKPSGKVVEIWRENFFKSNMLGKKITGTIQSVKNINRKEMVSFVQESYTGPNLVICVSGNIQEEEVKENIQKFFDKNRTGDKNSFQKMEKVIVKRNSVKLTKDIEQAHLYLGTDFSARTLETEPITEVANSLISGGFGSRLFQSIREKYGLAYYVYSDFATYSDIGKFTIGMGVDRNKISKAIEAVRDEIKDLIRGNISEQEVERAKEYIVGGLVTDLENTDDIAVWIGLQKLYFDKFYTVKDFGDKVRRVTKDDLLEFFKVNLENKELLLAGVLPYGCTFDENLVNNLTF